MCTTVIADDVTFEPDDGIGAFRVQIVQRGECEVEIVIKESVLQIALHRAIQAMQKRSEREANVIAFPLPQAHADIA